MIIWTQIGSTVRCHPGASLSSAAVSLQERESLQFIDIGKSVKHSLLGRERSFDRLCIKHYVDQSAERLYLGVAYLLWERAD